MSAVLVTAKVWAKRQIRGLNGVLAATLLPHFKSRYEIPSICPGAAFVDTWQASCPNRTALAALTSSGLQRAPG